MNENANPADKKGYDRYFQTGHDSKGLNRRLSSGRELSHPENLEWCDPKPVGAGKSVRYPSYDLIQTKINSEFSPTGPEVKFLDIKTS